MRATPMERGLAGIGIDELAQGIDTEIDIATATDVEQPGSIGTTPRGQRRRVQANELPERTGAGTMLRENLLEQPVLVMHAGLAGTRMDLPGKTDHITRLKEGLDKTNGSALKAVLDVRIKSNMCRHQARRVKPERSAPQEPDGQEEKKDEQISDGETQPARAPREDIRYAKCGADIVRTRRTRRRRRRGESLHHTSGIMVQAAPYFRD